MFGQEAIEQSSEGLTLYEGLTGNPNMLGSLMNMAIPLLLWQSYRSAGSRNQLILWLGLLGVVLGVLLLSVSRASIIAALITCGVFLAVVGIKRNALLYALAAVLLTGIFVAVPDVDETLEQRLRPKSSGGNRRLRFSTPGRRSGKNPTNRPSKAELSGGLWSHNWRHGFCRRTDSPRVRGEKGNSQLAIVEETGIVGLVLYAILLVILFRNATLPVRQSIDPDMKVMGAILLGCAGRADGAVAVRGLVGGSGFSGSGLFLGDERRRDRIEHRMPKAPARP